MADGIKNLRSSVYTSRSAGSASPSVWWSIAGFQRRTESKLVLDITLIFKKKRALRCEATRSRIILTSPEFSCAPMSHESRGGQDTTCASPV